MIIVLVGESSSGKSTIEKELFKLGRIKIISYTTRPQREGEVDGVDYHFISDYEFKRLQKVNFFAEAAEYRGWSYGSAKEDYIDGSVVVLTPHGLRQVKRIEELKLYSIYINVPRRDRLIKILQRGDDLEESYRRNLTDVGIFDGIKDEVDKVIDNDGYYKTPMELATIIHLLEIIKDGENN